MLCHSSKVAGSWLDTDWRRASRLRTLAVASLAFIVLLLPGRAVVAQARFWISTSGLPGLTPAIQAPTVLAANGSDMRLYIWAQPDTNKTLRNFSLDLVTTQPVIDFRDNSDSIIVYNPLLVDEPDPNDDVYRFQFVHDSAVNHFGLKSDITEQDVLANNTPDGIRGIEGFTISTGAGLGIGLTCHPNDPYCAPTSGGSPAWLLASVELRTLRNSGSTNFYLQIGANGMNYAGQFAYEMSAVFGDDSASDPDNTYIAGDGPQGVPGGERQTTNLSVLPYDTADFNLQACSKDAGDFNNSCKVDAGDYVLWRKSPIIYNALGGYPTWRSNYEKVSSMGSGSGANTSTTVPEPGTALLLLTGYLWIACRRAKRCITINRACAGGTKAFAIRRDVSQRRFSMNKRLKKRWFPVTARTTNIMVGLLALVIGSSCIRPQLALAVSKWWDVNGPVPGAGVPTGGTWDTLITNWALDSSGTFPTSWQAEDSAVFSAGTDATGPFTVTVSGTQTASGIAIEEGSVTFANGTVDIGTGSVVLNPGTLLSTNNAARIAVSSLGGYIINGPATLQNTNPITAGSFVDSDATIAVSGNLTIDYQTLSALNIIQTGSVIFGSGSLTKTGGGVIAIASASTYTGTTTINGGELRIRTTSNRLPITTDVTVNSPGILNLNAVSQQIGSLSGGGRVGLAGATLTVGNSSNTTFSGTIEVTANAGAAGSTAPGGNVTKVGTGILTLTGANIYTGTTTISAGTLQLGNGGSTGSVAGAIVNHAALVYNRSGTLTQSAAISGNGTLTKLGPGTVILAGTHSYTGATAINAGTLAVNGSIASNVTVNAAGTLGGTGTIEGTVTNNGSVAPGNSPGTVTVGSYTQSNSGVLEMEVAGTTTGTFDKLEVTGNASLDGILRVVNQTAVLPGTTIQLVTANSITPGTLFDDVETVGGNTVFAPNYSPLGGGVSVTSTTRGDMNRNNVVGLDDVYWFALALTDPIKYKASNTQNTQLPAGVPCICMTGKQLGNIDLNDAFDFDDIDDFATAAGVSGALIVAAIEQLSSVPEPNSSVLLALGILGAAAFAHRRDGRLPTSHTRSLAT